MIITWVELGSKNGWLVMLVQLPKRMLMWNLSLLLYEWPFLDVSGDDSFSAWAAGLLFQKKGERRSLLSWKPYLLHYQSRGGRHPYWNSRHRPQHSIRSKIELEDCFATWWRNYYRSYQSRIWKIIGNSLNCSNKIIKTITGRKSFRPDCLTEMFLFAVVEYAVERNVLVMISTDYCPNLASDVSVWQRMGLLRQHRLCRGTSAALMKTIDGSGMSCRLDLLSVGHHWKTLCLPHLKIL